MKISACIITLNEESNLSRCLKSLEGIVDEIIVVDSGSTDRTKEISKKFGAKFIYNEWSSYGRQKKFAFMSASHPWVFSIDADEAVSKELHQAISDLRKHPPSTPPNGYKICRIVNYKKSWVKHGDWYPDWLVRLFQKSKADITGDIIHEKIYCRGKTPKIKGHLFHYTYSSEKARMQRIEHYSRLWAKSAWAKNKHAYFFSPLLHASFRWVKGFILKRGFLDGFLGLQIANGNALECFLKYKYLRQSITIPSTKESSEKITLTKRAGIVSFAVIGSRILGLVREQLFAILFGAGKLLDSYLGAFQIPNLMRDLFAEGALSTAFTTVFTKSYEKDGEKKAIHLLNLTFTAIILFLSIICILGIIFAPWIVSLTNPGFHEVAGKYESTVLYTRVLFPFILFVSLAAVTMGVLNARSVFAIPASASSAFNLVSIVFGVFFAYIFDPQEELLQPSFGQRGMMGMCFGVLLGGMAQLGVQLPKLMQIGYRFSWKFDWKNSRLREMGKLMLPSVVAGAAIQINVLINGIFASHFDGARSWLNCAFRLVQFPLGVFAVAIATVTLPLVAAQHAQKNLLAFGNSAKNSLRLALFLTLPSALGLAFLSEQIISIIYEHGNFTHESTIQTAKALRVYSVGLVGYAALKVLIPCFYALNRPLVPLRVSAFSIIINLISNMFLVYVLHWGHVGLATSTSILALINFFQLAFALKKYVHLGKFSEWFQFAWRLLLSSGLCILTTFLSITLSAQYINLDYLLLKIAVLAFSIGASAFVFLLTANKLKLSEAKSIVQIITSRFS